MREVFDRLHRDRRAEIPPFFVFTKIGRGRDVAFRGLAVPGGEAVGQTEDLVAIWKTKTGQRFQNYRAIFTILDVPEVPRRWIDDLRNGNDVNQRAPRPWVVWRESGKYIPLRAPAVRAHRTPDEQLPVEQQPQQILTAIVDYYRTHPDGSYGFEKCAAALVRMMDTNVVSLDLTRPWRDGGRDGLGTYEIGDPPASVTVEFALEAKCKTPSRAHGCGVRDTARLLARLRHRQFGVFVTTSLVAEQAYKEIVEDRQPVIVIAGIDVVRILRDHGITTPQATTRWLRSVDEL